MTVTDRAAYPRCDAPRSPMARCTRPARPPRSWMERTPAQFAPVEVRRHRRLRHGRGYRHGDLPGVRGGADREAVATNGDVAVLPVNRGSAVLDQGKAEEVVANLRAAVRLKPDDVEAHYNLANTLRIQGKLEEAVAEFRMAIRIKPDYAEAHSNLGNALHAQGKPEEAVAEFRAAIRFKPDLAEGHYNLGTVSVTRGSWWRASPSSARRS